MNAIKNDCFWVGQSKTVVFRKNNQKRLSVSDNSYSFATTFKQAFFVLGI